MHVIPTGNKEGTLAPYHVAYGIENKDNDLAIFC